MDANDGKLGIWENDKCVQCGACCYELHMWLYERPCEYQKIVDSTSVCTIHDQRMPELCETFFCAQLDKPPFRTHQERLRNIALELGTAPQGYKNA